MGRPGTWQKGQSGNPKGGPVKNRALTALLERAGSKVVIVDGRKVAGKRWLAAAMWDLVTTGAVTLPSGNVLVVEPKDWLERHVGWLADECLMWPYAMRPEGYGRFKEGGTQQYAHRTMCRLAHGEPPSDGLEAAHSCGNGQSGCVNPRHLRWDTKQGNALDRVEHGTENRGERNGRAKLTAGQVLQIRRSTETQQSVADRMGISRQTVGDIRSGRRWGWMT